MIVNATGTLVEALNFGGSGDRTVNGVTFTGKTRGGLTPNSNFGGLNNSYSHPDVYRDGGVSNDFESLLDSFAWANRGGSPVTLIDLNIGTEYLIQFFVSDDRGCCDRELSWFTGGGAESYHTRYDMSYALTGTFIADATTQTLTIDGEYSSQLAGYQLRYGASVPSARVPEPASLALFGFGLVGIGLSRRRRLKK